MHPGKALKWHLTPKCDLDLKLTDWVHALCTSSHHYLPTCQVWSQYLEWLISYAPDTKFDGQIWLLSSICDLDLWLTDLVHVLCTSSNCHLPTCQVWSQMLAWLFSYAPDTKYDGQFWPLSSICDLDLGPTEPVQALCTSSHRHLPIYQV